MKTKCFFLFLLPLLILSACEDDDKKTNDPVSQLPPATQTGKNTFGYLVNGKPIVVRNTMLITAIYQGGQLQLGGGVDNGDMDIDIAMYLGEPMTTNTSYSLIGVSRYMDFDIDECQYDIEDAYEGSIIFSKIDRTNYIISGTFEFSTATEQCDTIHITDGRFDVKYIP